MEPTTTPTPVDDRPRPAFLDGPAKKLLIDGEWVDAASGKTFETIDPTTEQVLASAAAGDAEDVDRAVAAARRAFEEPTWKDMSPHERTRLLLTIAETVEAGAEDLAQLDALDNGTPIFMTRVMMERASECFRYYAGWPTKVFGSTSPSTSASFVYTVREPVGVCAGIIPWNSPVLMATWKIAPALACGNTVILKPAEQTPLSAVRLGELLIEAGVPAGVVNIVTGFGETAGAAIAAHPGIDKVAFTGSTETGKRILEASVANLKRVTLELGGKSPNVIFPDADLDVAAGAAASGFCRLSGQVCAAGTRVFVHESIADEFVEKLTTAAAGFTPGDPFDPEAKIGPLVSAEQFDRVASYLEAGRDAGAEARTGGSPIEGTGFFVEPTVFDGVSNDMKIAQEEIFGPVGSVIRFSDDAEAIRLANDTVYGLAAAVWTKDVTRAHRMSRALAAGTVWVNTVGPQDPMLPFGGYKQSGLGREHGAEAIEMYTETKTVMIQL
jgi:acyl-CoA reductase-like NAD-dependent aldehyde dehydrogenase